MAKEGAYQCSQQESSHPAIPMECFESKSQNNDECLQDTVQYTQKSESYMNKFLRNCLRPFRKRIHSQSDHKEEAEVKIKSAIKFHFESHYTKARKELRIPLKAFFHLLLVVLVTIQVSKAIHLISSLLVVFEFWDLGQENYFHSLSSFHFYFFLKSMQGGHF